MSKTIFILGGTGFIGLEVVIQAVEAGWQVRALVRSEEGARKQPGWEAGALTATERGRQAERPGGGRLPTRCVRLKFR